MASKVPICAIAVFAGLQGFITSNALAAAVNCGNTGSCDVDVHVENCVITAPDIDVFVATNIFWNIDQASKQAGYKYPAGPARPGVFMKDAPQGQFDPERLNDWKYKVHDRNTAKGTFHYGVRVVKGSTTCPDLDPSVVNH